MADRYLLESGAPDGYLLEDSSGVALLEVPTNGQPTMYVPSIYLAGFGLDSRNNYWIGNGREASYRFRASQASTPYKIAVNQRFGPDGNGYSLGTGGVIKIAIQADDGTGDPDGVDLISLIFVPGNPHADLEVRDYLDFPRSSTFVTTIGSLYHVRFTNIDPAPTSNWMSINAVYIDVFDAFPAQRQPAFTNDLSVLFTSAGVWKQPGDAGITDPNPQRDYPVFDLAYANGGHDGQRYFGNISGSEAEISGTTKMARSKFTVTGGDKVTVGGAYRVMRTAGSGDLTIGLYTGSNTLLASGTVPAANFPVVSVPPGNFYGSVWGYVAWSSPVTLTNGSTYYLRVSAPAGTTYWTLLLQGGELDESHWGSRAATDGAGVGGIGGNGEKTTDGTNWIDMYAFAWVDGQSYLSIVSQALTGSAAGAGTGSGTLALVRAATGAATGTGAAAGSLGLTLAASGSATGTGAAAANATRFVEVTGSASGTGAASGAAGLVLALSGSSAGAGTMSGSAGMVLGLAGSAAGAGTMAGTAGIVVAVSGAAAGAGTATGAPTRFAEFTGSALGQGQAAATVFRTLGLTGAANGVGSMTDSGAAVTHNVTGSATGTGAGAGAITRFVEMTGTALGQGQAAGASSITIGVSGSATGTGNATGSVIGTTPLTGSAAGSGTMSGSVGLTFAASGSASGVGSASGSARLTFGVTGSGSGTGAAVGPAILRLGVSGSASGVGLATGTARLRVGLTGAATGVGLAVGAMLAILPLSGSADGTGDLTGDALVFSNIAEFDPSAYAVVAARSSSAGVEIVRGGEVSQSRGPSATVSSDEPTAIVRRE